MSILILGDSGFYSSSRRGWCKNNWFYHRRHRTYFYHRRLRTHFYHRRHRTHFIPRLPRKGGRGHRRGQEIGLGLKESDIHGHKPLTRRRVVPFIPLLSRRITKENTLEGARVQLTTRGRVIMDKTDTTKYFGRNRKQGLRTEEDVKRSLFVQNLGRETINKIGSGENGVAPIGSRHVHKKTHAPSHVKKMPILAFSHPILLRGIGTRSLMDNAMSREILS
ncbi:hypothetical protein CsSME_00040262 [Camellia sinensis var. sinensis]